MDHDNDNYTRPTFTCSKKTMETPQLFEICSKLTKNKPELRH